MAYDSSTGVRLWKVQREKAVGCYGGALSVSPDGATAFVTDTAPPGGEGCGYRTTAYNTADGSLKWSSIYTVTAGAYLCGTSTDLKLSPDGLTVYVTGYGSRAPKPHTGFYQSGTVAYDTSTGDRLWISRYDGGGRGYASDLAVSPDGSSLFVTGQETMPCFAGCTSAEIDAPLVAYDTATGAERWATTYVDNLGHALAVSPDGSSVYLAGTFTASASTSKPASARAAVSCSDHCGYSTARYNAGPGPGRLQDADPSLRYDGWRSFFDKAAVGGAYRASNVTGDTAIFRTPKMTSVSWLTHRGPSQGKARLIIDGHSKGTFNLYSPTPSARTVTFDGLARQAHTVKVKVLGRKEPASKGTWVAVDGFRFHGGTGSPRNPPRRSATARGPEGPSPQRAAVRSAAAGPAPRR